MTTQIVSPDLKIENHGSVCLLRANTSAGQDWIDENIHAEGWQYFGGGIAIEPRYVPSIADGAAGDGLTIE